MSAPCQEETHAPQQTAFLFDDLVGAGEWPRPAQSSPPCASERRPIPKFARQSVRFSPASMTFLIGRRFEGYPTQSFASESRSSPARAGTHHRLSIAP